MISKKINRVLNGQIQAEFYASYLYLAMSAYAERANLPGFAAWMRRQSEEENSHAMRLFDFVLDRDGRVSLGEIAEPPGEFGTPLEMFEKVLEHERKVTKKIDEAYHQAVSERDWATAVELEWFVSEQVEEEKTAGDIVARIAMAQNEPIGLLLIDQELGSSEQPGAD